MGRKKRKTTGGMVVVVAERGFRAMNGAGFWKEETPPEGTKYGDTLDNSYYHRYPFKTWVLYNNTYEGDTSLKDKTGLVVGMIDVPLGVSSHVNANHKIAIDEQAGLLDPNVYYYWHYARNTSFVDPAKDASVVTKTRPMFMVLIDGQNYLLAKQHLRVLTAKQTARLDEQAVQKEKNRVARVRYEVRSHIEDGYRQPSPYRNTEEEMERIRRNLAQADGERQELFTELWQEEGASIGEEFKARLAKLQENNRKQEQRWLDKIEEAEEMFDNL